MAPSSKEITQWLVAWSNGDRAALDQLIPLAHEELRRLAKRYMRQERGRGRRVATLQNTAPVNEIYLRLIDAGNVRWESRAHFFAISARLIWMMMSVPKRVASCIAPGYRLGVISPLACGLDPNLFGN